MKYRLYIDEVGNSDINSSKDPNHRYLSLTGIILELEYVAKVVFPELEHIKQDYFKSHPDEPVVLHRKELISKKYPFEILKDVEIEQSFNEALLSLLQKFDYGVVTVTIDKQEYQQKYKVLHFDPYHYSLAIMVGRYIEWLKVMNAVGDVMAESRGGNEDRRLKASFERAYTEGFAFVSANDFEAHLTSKQLKVKLKGNNIAGLQLADIIAYPSYRIMLAGKEQKLLPDSFGSKIGKILEESKYIRNYSGRVEDWGRIWLP